MVVRFHRCRRFWDRNLPCPFGSQKQHEDVEEEDNEKDPARDARLKKVITEPVRLLAAQEEKPKVLDAPEGAQANVSEPTKAVSAGTAGKEIDVFNENTVSAISESGTAMADLKVTPVEMQVLHEIMVTGGGVRVNEQASRADAIGVKIPQPATGNVASRGPTAGREGEIVRTPTTSPAKVRVESRGATSGTDIADMLGLSETIVATGQSNLLAQLAVLETVRRLGERALREIQTKKAAPKKVRTTVRPKGPPSVLDRPSEAPRRPGKGAGQAPARAPAGGGFRINYADRIKQLTSSFRRRLAPPVIQ